MVLNKDGISALMAAAKTARRNAVSMILESFPVKINMEDSSGATALIWATLAGDPSTIALLIKNGADVNIKEKDGWTALHYAVGKGDIEVVKLILESGGDPNAATRYKQTPLEIASKRGNKHAKRMLTSFGAR